jgi:hypothetical protein
MWPNWELFPREHQTEAGLVMGLVEDDIMGAVSSECGGWIDIRGFNLVSDYI